MIELVDLENRRQRAQSIADMRTCFIVPGFHSPWNEGSKVIAKSIICGLSRRINVSVVSPVKPTSARGACGRADITRVPVLMGFPGASYVHEMRVLKAVGKVDREGAKAYHLFDGLNYSYAAAVATMYRKPVLIHSTIYDLYYMDWLDRIRYVAGSKFYARYASIFLCSSSLVADRLLRHGIARSMIRILPPGVDSKVFRPLDTGEARKAMNIDRNAFLVSYVGTVRPMRFPWTVVIETIRQLVRDGHDNVKLHIVCPVEFYDNTGVENRRFARTILSEAKALGLSSHVTIVQMDLREDEKVLLYNASNVVLLPFMRPVAVDPPISMLEAMACGRVVVGSKIQSIPSIIKHRENGLLLAEVTTDELYGALRLLIEQHEEVDALGIAARKAVVGAFDLDSVLDRLLNVYDAIGLL